MLVITQITIEGNSLVPSYSNISVVNGRLNTQTIGTIDQDDITNLDLTATVNNIITGGGGGGLVVAKVVLTGIAATILPTNFYTIPATGLYRINLSGLASGTGGSLAAEVDSVNFMGDLVSFTIGGGMNTMAQTNAVVAVFVVGDILSYQVSSVPSTSNCSLYIAVEKLI